LEIISKQRADACRATVDNAIAKPTAPAKDGEQASGPELRREAARAVIEASTRVLAESLATELERLKDSTNDRSEAAQHLDLARKMWAGFEHEIKATDQPMFREIGLCWLKLASALGSAPLLGQGASPIDAKTSRLSYPPPSQVEPRFRARTSRVTFGKAQPDRANKVDTEIRRGNLPHEACRAILLCDAAGVSLDRPTVPELSFYFG